MPRSSKILKNLTLSASCLFSTQSFAATFISELHYDNSGPDVNEAIEISTDLDTDLSGWSLSLYNGSNGSVYNTINLSTPTPDNSCGSNGGVLVINFPSNGIQNGAPDGMALINSNGDVVEFLSYEGEFTASNGAAAGMTSTNIDVRESSTTSSSESLQLVSGVWQTPSDNTFGICTTDVEAPTPAEDISISELHYDNSGSDTGEAIELTGSANASVSGWQIVLYNGSNGAPYQTRTLSGTLSAVDGCEDGTHVEYISGIQNGSPDAIALLNPAGEVSEFISYEGTLTAASGPAAGMTSTDIGVSETSSTPVGHSLKKIDSVWTTPTSNNFGACNDQIFTPELVFIHEIQGSGNAVNSQEVFTVEAIVTGDFQSNAQLRGFFIQEEDTDADSDPQTSEAIFVFCSSCNTDVNVGDQVRVTGLANEFFGMSQITATFDSDVSVLANGQALPTATQLHLPVATTASDLSSANSDINAYYESVEGMIISIPQTLSVAEYFQLARFGQVVLSANGRPHQFTDAHYPTESGFTQHQIDLATRRIILDDDNNTQNAALFNDTPVAFPSPGFSTSNYFRGGDTIQNLTGILHWSWAGSGGTDAWRIRPMAGQDYSFTPINVREDTPRNVAADLKIASFNVLNYFTTIDDGNDNCGPEETMECRGADSTAELARQTQKIVSAICEIDADILGLMEIQNPALLSTESPVATLVNAINASCPDYAAIETGTVGTDAISVAIIYQPAAVEPIGSTAILDTPEFTDPNNTGVDKNRPAIAQSFKELAGERTVTVVTNHLKSKGSSCGAGDDDTTTGQGNCNLTRTMAAQAQAAWLESNPTGVFNRDYTVVMGDLNAYRNEDPITAFLNAGYIDAIDFFNGPEAYSFVFDGQLGYLDHALVSEALLPHVVDVVEWHINADEVNLFDYNDTIRDSSEASFHAKPSALPLFEPSAFRSSDHDPVIIGVQFPDRPLCSGSEPTIYVEGGVIVGGPMNGQTYTGTLTGSSEGDVILGTASSDIIFGGAGNDIICAGNGNDEVQAQGGHDIVIGDLGTDLVIGGNGLDQCEAETTQQCEK